LSEAKDTELDCDAFLDIMAEYVEACVDCRPLEGTLLSANEHAQRCCQCGEESQAVIAMMRKTEGEDTSGGKS
jgi:hypothetical protein